TVIAGGELRMEMLELTLNEHLGLAEAPLQLKAAGGTLVIDDLGRQVMPPATLLNRWIVPLDRGVDHLTLPDGTPLVVPFDPFVVFSTNLDPKDLADEAFLRRIPYKLAIDDPDPDTFAELLTLEARRLKLKFEDGVEDGILAWFADSGTPMRACHPRDILRQVEARQRFLGREPVVSQTAITDVLRSYFVA
ncbi:MAG: ATPase, partial [Myxococcales bacterium]|nr:ATPase [Myxococcales bacterium]